MILSDADIVHCQARHQLVEPFIKSHLQPSSLDLTLANGAKRMKVSGDPRFWLIDPMRSNELVWEEVSLAPEYIIPSGGFLLAASAEYFRFPHDMVGRLDGKSSLARLGLMIHSTAGFFDPGFEGTATLEIFNCAPLPIVLRQGMRIAQMSFHQLSSPAVRPYGHPELNSKYQGQVEAEPSRYHENDGS